jgi:hypothetical protein
LRAFEPDMLEMLYCASTNTCRCCVCCSRCCCSTAASMVSTCV